LDTLETFFLWQRQQYTETGRRRALRAMPSVERCGQSKALICARQGRKIISYPTSSISPVFRYDFLPSLSPSSASVNKAITQIKTQRAASSTEDLTVTSA